jgi:hypothetical protein
MSTTTTVAVRERSAPMSLHFDDIDPVAECHVAGCKWHGHGDSVRDAANAWVDHLAAAHPRDWD